MSKEVERDERDRHWLAFLLGVVGATVMAALTLDPQVAIRNLTGWRDLFLTQTPLALQIFLGGVLGIGFVLYGGHHYLRALQKVALAEERRAGLWAKWKAMGLTEDE